MSNKTPVTATMVTDPLNRPARLGETDLQIQVKDSLEAERIKNKKGSNLLVPKSISSVMSQNLIVGTDNGNIYYSVVPKNFRGYIGLPNLQTLRLANLSEFRLNIVSNWFYSEDLVITTLPTSDFSMNIWLVMGFVRSNEIYSDPTINYFIPIFADNWGTWDVSSGGYMRMNPVLSKNYNLLDFATSSDRAVSTGRLFLGNTNKLLESEVNQIWSDGASLVYGIFIDTTGISGDNLTYFNNNLNSINIVTSLSFNYTGVQAISG